MEEIKRKVKARLSPEHAIYLLTALVLATSLIASVFAWQGQKSRLADEGERDFQSRVDSVYSSLNQRMTAYEEILRGSGAFIQTSDNISFTNWQNFMEVSGAVSRYPGTKAIGFSPIVDKDLLPLHENFADRVIPYNYDVHNRNSDLDILAPIFFVEPLQEDQVSILGYDLLSSQGIRSSLLKAHESGEIQVSRALSEEEGVSGNDIGLIIILPVRSTTENFEGTIISQDNVMGFVYLGVSTTDIFADIKSRNSNDTFGFRIISNSNDNTEDIELTRTSGFNAIKADVAHSDIRTIDVANLGWQVQFVANEFFDHNVNTLLPTYVLAGGVALSVLFSGIFLYANLQRYEAIQRSKQEEIANAKRDIVALTSHQLRTPATAVKQYISMILQGYAGELANEEQRLFLESAYASNEHQLDTINELLLVAKADARQLRLDVGKFDIVKLVQQEIADQKSSFDSRNQKVKYKGPKKLDVYGDKKLIRIIVENLLSNAGKYSLQSGKVNVNLSKQGRYVEIAFIDEGVGISTEDFTKLFKKFSRIENKLSRRVGGSGIGLYLSKQLAELHGGDIAVKSTKGEGSKFILRIPLKIKEEDILLE